MPVITIGVVAFWAIGGAVSALGGWLFHKATRSKKLRARYPGAFL